MRTYDVATIANSLSCPNKWVDNVLSRHTLPGVIRARQGISRQVSFEGLVHLALVQALVSEMALPLDRAVRLAVALCATGGRTAGTGWCELRVDLDRLRGNLALALRDAVETTARPKRGRPPLERGGAGTNP